MNTRITWTTIIMILACSHFEPAIHAEKNNSNEGANHLAKLVRQSGRQERTHLKEDGTLNLVAQHRAQDMVDRGYFDVIDPDGIGMNTAVQLARYQLPYGGDLRANSVAIIASIEGLNISATTAAEIVFNDFFEKEDPASQHLFGETDFAKQQTYLGVGYASPPNDFINYVQHIFVVLTAPPFDIELADHVVWLFQHLTPAQIMDKDPDQDGIGNLMEYVMNTDPLSKSPGLSISIDRDTTTQLVTMDLSFIQLRDETLQVAVFKSNQWIDPVWQMHQTFSIESRIQFEAPRDAQGMLTIDIVPISQQRSSNRSSGTTDQTLGN